MVVDVAAGELGFVHGQHAPGKRPQVSAYAVRVIDDTGAGLARARRELSLQSHRCVTLLAAGEYQMVVVEAPNVPRDELKTAIRWRVKDLLDFHVDDATIDVLDIPVPKDAPARNHTMYAVAARNEVLQSRITTFQAADVALSVVDIPETAQRNIAALYEEPGRAVAALYCDARGALLTLNFQTELYFTRRFEIPMGDLASCDARIREEAHARTQLELQRSLDHFERAFRSIVIARLLVAPEPAVSGLAESLTGSFDFPVQAIDLNDVIGFDGGAIEPRLQWRLFHLIGASLRHEAKAL